MADQFTWLTAPGLAALSVLHLRGEGAATFLSTRGWRDSEKPRHVWLKNARGEALDEVMVAREDGGFTVTCHGGPAVRAAFQMELRASGFVEAAATELSLFGATTRYRREMLHLLTQAQSDKGVRYCLWALEHGEAALARALDELADLAELAWRSEPMRYFFDPVRVHLWGPVNAGKSSLLNALCREKLAAVGDEPGLTRDVIEGRFESIGYTVRVFDTPGEGVQNRSELDRRAFDEARAQAGPDDWVLHLIPPGAQPLADKDAMVVFSRCDEQPGRAIRNARFPCEVSIHDPASIAHLRGLIAIRTRPGVSPEGDNAFAVSSELREDLRRLANNAVGPDDLRRKWL